MRSIKSSETACSMRSASECTPSQRRELHAAIWHVLDQAGFGETFYHAAHRGRREIEHRGDLARGREAALVGEMVDDLEVVLDRPGERGGRLMRERVHAQISGRNGGVGSHGPTICG